jgi:hypothetical protein
MISIRKSHGFLWLAGFGLFFFFALGSSFDLGLVPLALAAAGHFIANVVFAARTRRKRRLSFDSAWYAAHPESSPEALVEVFDDEKRGSDFSLPVRLEAECSGGSAQHAPLSQAQCVGWGIEVELYKSTILGGDADYTPLEHSSGFDAFEVRYGTSTISVQPPGVVRGMEAREDLLGWSLLDEHPGLRKIVDNAMQLQKLPRPKYSGVRVRESVFAKGDTVSVWGTAAKGASGVVVRGSDSPGAPDALLVSPSGVRRRQNDAGYRVADRRRLRSAIRMGVNTVLAAGMLALAVVIGVNAGWWRLEQAYPWLNVDRVGPLHWTGDGKRAEVVCRTLNFSGSSSWSLDPQDDSVNLVSGDQKVLVDAHSRITITRARLAAYTVLPGSVRYPIFGLGVSFFIVPREAAAVPEVSVHEGNIVVDNRSPTEVEIRFKPSTTRKELADTYWTIDAGQRTRLVLHDSGFSLTEGDGVLLRRAGESARRDIFVTLGGNPAVTWVPKDKQWVLTVDARALAPRSATLHVRNPNAFDVRLSVFAAGSDTARDTWTLPAGFGGAAGIALESGGAPFVFNEGDSVSIEPLAVVTLYDGPLGACPIASWKDGLWTLHP